MSPSLKTPKGICSLKGRGAGSRILYFLEEEWITVKYCIPILVPEKKNDICNDLYVWVKEEKGGREGGKRRHHWAMRIAIFPFRMSVMCPVLKTTELNSSKVVTTPLQEFLFSVFTPKSAQLTQAFGTIFFRSIKQHGHHQNKEVQ